MKSFFALVLIVAVLESANAVTKQYAAKALAAKNKCSKQFNIDDETIKEYLEQRKLPETQEGKCFIACYMEEVDMMKNGKMNVEGIKAGNKQKWEDAQTVAKADQAADMCNNELSSDGKNKCDVAVDIVSCMVKHGKQMGIPPPDLKNVSRR